MVETETRASQYVTSNLPVLFSASTGYPDPPPQGDEHTAPSRMPGRAKYLGPWIHDRVVKEIVPQVVSRPTSVQNPTRKAARMAGSFDRSKPTQVVINVLCERSHPRNRSGS